MLTQVVTLSSSKILTNSGSEDLHTTNITHTVNTVNTVNTVTVTHTISILEWNILSRDFD